MPDREKVIKGLELCSNILGCIGNIDPKCPYALRDGGCRHNDLLSDALALLKEQEAVVRCKDCKHYMTMHCNCGGCFISDDWYCADGERTDNDA